MPIISGGGGGGGGPAAGTYLPVAGHSGVTVDTTTYADPIKGGGAKLTTLIFPADSTGALLAIAQVGDAHPRVLMAADPTVGWFIGDGTFDVFSTEAFALVSSFGATSNVQLGSPSFGGLVVGSVNANAGVVTSSVGPVQVDEAAIIHSGTGVPAVGGNVGDLYIRQNPAGDSTYFYRCTVAGTAGNATWVAITGA